MRIALNAHALFKAQIYSYLSQCLLFVESNAKQAEKIATMTEKQVICTENDVIYGP